LIIVCLEEIDALNIKAFCEDNEIKCSLEEAALLIDQYDESENGKLNYNEFCQLILPTTDDHLRSIAKSREAEYKFIKSAFLSKPIESALANLIHKEIIFQRSINEIKKDLASRRDFNVERAFDEVLEYNAKGGNKIDRYAIRDFVNEFFALLSEDDLDAIIRRCDTDEDEMLDEEEFKLAVMYTRIDPVITRFSENAYKYEGEQKKGGRQRDFHKYRFKDLVTEYCDRRSYHGGYHHRNYSHYYAPEYRCEYGYYPHSYGWWRSHYSPLRTYSYRTYPY
jgi:Ca2+-binding EF-hand superfamily protein